MCGVVGLVYDHDNPSLGEESCELLKKLEYRGYDSTGAVFFKQDDSFILKKKVGAPSRVTEELKMAERSGYKFIGQVRWATFGSVTDENAQPHAVECLEKVFGAHNGNISNTDTLKDFLTEASHRVVSDNDGEILVHMVEHYYHELLDHAGPLGESERLGYFREAIKAAQRRIRGSYAACLTADGIPGVFAIKAGSSLYAGLGSDDNGEFVVVSSDLTSVLSKTRLLIPLAEGEGLYFTHNDYRVFPLDGEGERKPEPVRSKLNVADISLRPKYQYFMEQEIFTSPANLDILSRYYLERDGDGDRSVLFEAHLETIREILARISALGRIIDPSALAQAFRAITATEGFRAVREAQSENGKGEAAARGFASEEAALFSEILGEDEELAEDLFLADALVQWKKKRAVLRSKRSMLELLERARTSGARVFVVASGTSYHAAMTAAYFFNRLARIALVPANPGAFRSMYLDSLAQGDVVIGISQSGETKDLVDVFNDVRSTFGDDVRLVSVVNNENSTIPQEKSEFYLPVLCGPEIAVAATKSFTSQIGLFYLLALNIGMPDSEVVVRLSAVRAFLEKTVVSADIDLSDLAGKLFLEPSMHILGTSLVGLAKEGALKIREVVINHTEGYDSAEFKHGPNTILGKNTGFSFLDLERLHKALVGFFKSSGPIPSDGYDLVSNARLDPRGGEPVTGELAGLLDDYRKAVDIEDYFTNYPLVFICPPTERDKRITVAQIHTHKIRGANVILIAEPDEELKKAVEGKPAGIDDYYSHYVELPTTSDPCAFAFNAAIVLQLLAFKMSVRKRKYLNANHVADHGVHPDVPKNVSKSITVD